jgi:hypothetical protein
MATRRGPGDPVDPFASLPLGQTLSGERERERDAARRALDASLGRNLSPDSLLGRVLADDPPVMSEQAIRTAETIAALRETPDEAARSADLADVQRQLAARAEQARQRTLREAREREQRIAADRAARVEEARRAAERERQAEQVRRDEERFDRDVRVRQSRQSLDDAPDATILTAIEQRLQRKVEAVQRALNTLSDDLADVRQMLAKKTPAPTGNEEAPFREGERHLDLGGTE